MNIIAVSYTNLGPFADQTVSVVIHPGSAMIVAPVGTGKSMLFFDGIVYGLYKYSTRDVLNISATQGFLSVLFEIDGELWLVQRQVQRGKKSKSTSTTSRLGRYYGSINTLYETYPQIVYHDVDVLADLNVEFEIFKNESDLQHHLEQLLPQRDVFMNRDMMMQESSNIFDLTQTERITVFKHLFNLLDIDVAKEHLAEEKIKLKYMLQAKKDNSAVATKFVQLIHLLDKINQGLSEQSIISSSDCGNDMIRQWINESVVMGTHITLDKASLIVWDRIEQLRILFEKKKTLYHQYQTQRQYLEQQDQQLGQKLTELAQKGGGIQEQIFRLETDIKSYDPKQLQLYKSHKLELIQQINDLEFSVDYDRFDANVSDLQQAYDAINQLIQQGKELGIKLTSLDTQLKSLQERQQLELTNHESQVKMLEQQLAALQTQLDSKQEKLTIAARFYCVKIEADCPFVNQISEGVIAAHERELDVIQQQYHNVSNQLSTLSNQGANPSLDYSAHLSRLQQERTDIEHTIASLKQQLSSLGYKTILDIYPRYQQLQSQLKEIDQQIIRDEQKQGELDGLVLELQGLKLQYEHLVNEKSMITQEQQTVKSDLAKLMVTDDYQEDYYRVLGQVEQQVQQLSDTIDRINELISDYKTSQQDIIKLETRAKRVDELYTIVSKELTVLVLQEYLPLLSDMINNQLAKVVDYRLEFSINQAGDKLEIMIRDDKGTREIRSLSGGQRTILRLCWILAVALWSGNKFLFLDETINHLDRDMISAAAELLEDFVRGNQVTLYAITHSEQIQELDIWDHVVRLKEVL